MKYITGFARTFVGILFIISGFIKLNDPVGFSFKLEEYFSQGVLNLPFLMPYALAIAIVIVIFEMILGVFLLLGFQRKFTVWSLLLMILFFTFLTFYSAYFNKVTDCGCFGDAVKLTPWESFIKDVVLLVLIIILFAGRRHLTALFRPNTRILLAGIVLLGSIFYVHYVLNHLPQIDFRPYKIGVNIAEGMKVPEDAPKALFEYSWKFNVEGEEKVVITNGEYPTVDGEFIDVKTREIQAGYVPPIHDFSIGEEGNDVTTQFLEEEHLLLVIAYDLNKSQREVFPGIKKVTDKALGLGYKVAGLSASNLQQAESLIDAYDLKFDFYFTDETTLKTIVRSNPGLLLLNRGTILQKLHYNDAGKLELDAVKNRTVAGSSREEDR